MSQQDLGLIADTYQKNISKYEKDLVIPSATTLKKVTTDYLLGNEKMDTVKDTALMQQFQEIDKMPEEEKGASMKVINAYIRDFKTKSSYAS